MTEQQRYDGIQQMVAQYKKNPEGFTDEQAGRLKGLADQYQIEMTVKGDFGRTAANFAYNLADSALFGLLPNDVVQRLTPADDTAANIGGLLGSIVPFFVGGVAAKAATGALRAGRVAGNTGLLQKAFSNKTLGDALVKVGKNPALVGAEGKGTGILGAAITGGIGLGGPHLFEDPGQAIASGAIGAAGGGAFGALGAGGGLKGLKGLFGSKGESAIAEEVAATGVKGAGTTAVKGAAKGGAKGGAAKASPINVSTEFTRPNAASMGPHMREVGAELRHAAMSPNAQSRMMAEAWESLPGEVKTRAMARAASRPGFTTMKSSDKFIAVMEEAGLADSRAIMGDMRAIPGRGGTTEMSPPIFDQAGAVTGATASAEVAAATAAPVAAAATTGSSKRLAGAMSKAPEIAGNVKLSKAVLVNLPSMQDRITFTQALLNQPGLSAELIKTYNKWLSHMQGIVAKAV